MNKKIIIGIAILITLIVGIFIGYVIKNGEEEVLSGEVIEQEKSDKSVLDIVTLSWAPFTYEEDGEFRGIGVDLLDEAMNNLNINYNLVFVPWSRA